MKVYADNAATTRVHPEVIREMLPYFDTVYGNPSSLHSAGQEAKEALESARSRIAAHLGCTPREVYFTSGGTEADNMAIRSAAYMAAARTKSTSFPLPLSTTLCCTPCRSWKRKALKSLIWMCPRVTMFPHSRLRTPSVRIPAWSR